MHNDQKLGDFTSHKFSNFIKFKYLILGCSLHCFYTGCYKILIIWQYYRLGNKYYDTYI